LDDIDKVTADDVQRVARQYFKTENRTVSLTYQPETGESEGGAK
jgi:predicted Zn-dependent peptidase